MGNYWMYQRELHTLFDYNKTSLGSYIKKKNVLPRPGGNLVAGLVMLQPCALPRGKHCDQERAFISL